MKNLMKKVGAITLALVMVFALASCGASDSAEDSTAEEVTYKVGTEPTFPPFEFTDEESGDIVGFDVDLMEAIAKDQGFKLDWANTSFDGLIPALKSGNIDIIAAGMYASEERAEEVDFSETYYDSGIVFVVKDDDDTFKGEESLKPDMKIGAQAGTTNQEQADKYVEEGKIAETKNYNGVDVGLLDVKNGVIDAMLLDKPSAQAYIQKQEGEFKIVGEPLTAESFGFAVAKGNTELLDQINAGLTDVKDSGEFDKIYKEWFE